MTDHPPHATVTQLAESRETWMEEAERWKREAEKYYARLKETLEDCDKYQAALERIANEHPDHPGNTMSIVREALS